MSASMLDTLEKKCALELSDKIIVALPLRDEKIHPVRRSECVSRSQGYRSLAAGWKKTGLGSCCRKTKSSPTEWCYREGTG